MRLGGTVTLYVDGVGTVLTSTLGTTTLYDGGHTHVIGSQSTGADRAFNGYVDEVRVTKGVARYTGAFAVPTAAHLGSVALDPSAQKKVSVFTYDASGRLLTRKDPLNRVTTYAYYSNSTDFSNPAVGSDPGFGSVSLLLHGDGADGATSFARQQPGAQSGHGGRQRQDQHQPKASLAVRRLYFDGVRDYISVPADPSLAMKSSDFTIEMWVYKLANNPNTSRLWNPDGDLITGIYLTIAADGNLVSAGSSNGTSFNAWNGPGVLHSSNNVWTHLALVRSGGTRDLVRGWGWHGPHHQPVGRRCCTTKEWRISSVARLQALIAEPFSGYLDDVRITKGLARYTANFTPPAQAFANSGAGA